MKSRTITPPIFADDEGDINAFPSVQAACEYMEPVDVMDGHYDIFDGRGHLLTVSVKDDRVQIEPSKDLQPFVDLRVRLVNFLEKVPGHSIRTSQLKNPSLDEAVRAATTLLWS